METKMQKSSEEIDLIALFRPIITRAGRQTLAYFQKLKRNAFTFISILLLFTLMGFSARYVLPPLYRSNALVVSQELSPDFCRILLNNLQDQAKNKANISLIAGQLGIAPESVAALKEISVEQLPFSVKNQLTNEAGTDSLGYVLRLNMVVSNSAAIADLQKGIRNCLENNEYASKRTEIKRKKLLELQKDLSVKMQTLDSLKTNMDKALSGKQSGFLVMNPAEVLKVQSDMHQQLLNIEEQLSYKDNIEFVQPFLQTNAVNYFDFSKLLVYSIIIGIALSALLTPLIGKR